LTRERGTRRRGGSPGVFRRLRGPIPGILLILAFGLGVSPATLLHSCPLHTYAHRMEARHAAASGHGSPTASPTTAMHTSAADDAQGSRTDGSGVAEGGDGSMSSMPCDCLGLCLTCCFQPVRGIDRTPTYPGTVIANALPALRDLPAADPAAFLIPLAQPPPA
jgi:hypothetical protein